MKPEIIGSTIEIIVLYNFAARCDMPVTSFTCMSESKILSLVGSTIENVVVLQIMTTNFKTNNQKR